jgi:class 3 adenylate cyclase/tetratricopeptide (TPR) repeat protein
MKCPHCHTELPEGSKFCNECGQKLEVGCPECGKANPPASKFCLECGHDMRKPVEAEPIDYSQPQSYTPKHLADKILTTRSSIEGERKLVTILFADVANSTAMFENLDPEAVHEIMDGCFRLLMNEIHRYEGTINQFRGDGIMALFGAPIAHEDHAQRACHAALAIQKAMAAYGESLKNRYGINFRMRVGLNTGPVVVGAIGDDLRMDYTAQGDTANLAARMETSAEPGSVFVARHTHELAREFFEFAAPLQLQVKGKEHPQLAYQLLRRGLARTRIDAALAKGLTRFCGRVREMEGLKLALERAGSGSGQVVGIVGEAGVGKSRLILELRGGLDDEAYTYLEGRCLHYGGSMAYLPIVDILRSYFEIKEAEREFAIKEKIEQKVLGLDEGLRPVLPVVQQLLSLTVDDKAFARFDPLKKREATFEGIRNLFIRESQDRPMVMVVDDLHWIDRTSEDLLDYLIGWLPKSHILMILLYRPEYVHSWASKSYYTNIGVDHLPSGTSLELVQSILDGSKVAPECADAILSRTSGNPLFLEELTRSLLENGSIQKKEGQYVLSRPASEIRVPSNIQGIIAARMDRLEETLKKILQVASVIGRDFAFRILQAITGMREELKSSLLNLQGLEFIYEKNLFPELEYIFKHALTQEVAYNSLLVKSRMEIHEKIAQAIETLYADRPDEFYEMLAYHYDKSENFQKAIEYWRLAARRSLRLYAVPEAIAYLAGAYAKIQKLPQSDEREELTLDVGTKLGFAYLLRNMVPKALAVVRPLERLAQEKGHPKTVGRMFTILGLAQVAHEVDLKRGIESLKRAQELSKETNDIPTMSFSGSYLGWAYWCSGDFHSARATWNGLIERLDAKKSGYTLCVPFSSLAFLSTAQGDLTNAEKWAFKALALAEKLDESFTKSWANTAVGKVLREKGRVEEAGQYLTNALENAKRISLHITMEFSLVDLTRLTLTMGQSQAASAYARYLRESIETGGMAIFKTPALALQAEIELRAGNWEACRMNLEKALECQVPIYEGHLYRVWGEFHSKAQPEDRSAAETWFKKAIESHERIGMPLELARDLVSYADMLKREGLQTKAADHYSRALDIFTNAGNVLDAGRVREAMRDL